MEEKSIDELKNDLRVLDLSLFELTKEEQRLLKKYHTDPSEEESKRAYNDHSSTLNQIIETSKKIRHLKEVIRKKEL